MRKLASLFVCAWFAGSAIGALIPKDPGDFVVGIPTKRNEVMQGQLLVKYLPSYASTVQKSAVVQAFESETTLIKGSRFMSRIGSTGWTLWKIPTDLDPRVAAKMINREARNAFAQPVHRVYPLYQDPDDPDYDRYEDSEDLIMSSGDEIEPFRRLWHLVDTFTLEAWADYPNQWYTAANKPTNVPLIAVIDTGGDMTHPDFRNRDGFGTDVSQGGQLVNNLSKQFRFGELDVNGTPEDQHGHGTHVAGLAFAAGHNRGLALGGAIGTGASFNGTIGVGYNAKGMILRVFDSEGVGTDADAAAALIYAADSGADIINLSIGTESFSQLFQDAVTYAWQKGCLVVAAGNEDGSGGGDLGPIYPAACSGALGVTANGPDYIPAHGTYSGDGYYVDVAAPGGDVVIEFNGLDFLMKIQFVWSTAMQVPGTLHNHPQLNPPYTLNYAYLAGTSMATPIVSGAAALYYGKYGLFRNQGWVNVQAYRAIQKSALSILGAPNGGWEPNQGYGALDTEGLLQGADARNALVGSIEGIVYANATAIGNVQVRARRNSNGVLYSTTTQPDGTYRFDQLPPGQYTMTTAPFGLLKSKQMIVKAGSDSTGVDFWCGSFTWDEDPPVVARWEVPFQIQRTDITVTHWAYDTETGIDKFTVQIGTTPGGSDVMAPTEIVPDGNKFKLVGLDIRPKRLYHMRGTYTNGAGMTSTVDGTFTYSIRR